MPLKHWRDKRILKLSYLTNTKLDGLSNAKLSSSQVSFSILKSTHDLGKNSAVYMYRLTYLLNEYIIHHQRTKSQRQAEATLKIYSAVICSGFMLCIYWCTNSMLRSQSFSIYKHLFIEIQAYRFELVMLFLNIHEYNKENP